MLQQLQWVALLCVTKYHVTENIPVSLMTAISWLPKASNREIQPFSEYVSGSRQRMLSIFILFRSIRKGCHEKNGLLLNRSGNCRFAYVFNFSEVWLYSFFKEQAALKSVWLLLIIFLCYSPIALNNRSSCPCFWSGQNESSSVSGSFRIVREGSGLRIIFSK